jgi:hypothetical protein
MADVALTMDPAVESEPISPDFETPESTPDGPASSDGSTETPSEQAADTTASAAAAPTNEPAIIGNRLSPSAWKMISELKKTNPRQAAEIKAALFDSHNFRQIAPGGVKEIQELRTQLEDLGGVQAIKDVKENLAFFEDWDSKFSAGDPQALETLLSEPAGQQGFVNLIPQIIGKYKEIAPDHYDAFVARQQLDGMNAARLDSTITLMDYLLTELQKDKPEMAERFIQQRNAIVSYYNSVSERAGKKVDLPQISKPTAPGSDDREQKIAERERNVIRTEWISAGNSERMKIFNSEWARLVKDRNLSPEKADAVKELYASRLAKAMSALPKFNERAQAFFSANDREGFLRHAVSAWREQIPRVLRASMDAVISGKAVPKATPPANGNGALPDAAPKPGAPATGFTWVGSMPDKNKINFAKTTPAMIREGKAILDDGKRVQWRGGL